MTMENRQAILAECDRLDQSGQYEEAVLLLTKAIAADPDEMSYFVARGRVRCDRLGEVDAGLSDFQQAVSINPNSAIPYQHLSLAFLLLGDPTSASQQAERALDLDDTDALSHYVLAKCRLASGRVHSAIRLLESALKIESNSSLYWGTLGNAYLKLEQLDKAKDAYERAIALNSRAILFIGLAQIQLELGDARSALGSLESASQFELNDVEQLLVDQYKEVARAR